jgi:nucleoside permease NupC
VRHDGADGVACVVAAAILRHYGAFLIARILYPFQTRR